MAYACAVRASACRHRLTGHLYARVDVQERAGAFGVLAIDGVSGWCVSTKACICEFEQWP